MGEYNYPSNSDRARAEGSENKQHARVDSVVPRKSVRRRARGPGGLFESSLHEVADYVLHDVIVPMLKRTLYDSICNGLGMFLGERRQGDMGKGSYPAERVSYCSYYGEGRGGEQAKSASQARRTGYTDMIFETRGDAEIVLERMHEILRTFDAVSVADFYDLIGEKTEFTDNKYGWLRLNGAGVRRIASGDYILELPRPQLL